MLVNRQYSVTYQVVGSSVYFSCGIQVSFNTNNSATINHILLCKVITETHNNEVLMIGSTGLIKSDAIIILSATRMVDTP